MAKEIELKLGLPASHARRVTAHPLLGGYKPQRYRLFNTYYDTPEFDLRNRGIALRLRRKGWSTWLMTVKGGAANGKRRRSPACSISASSVTRRCGSFLNPVMPGYRPCSRRISRAQPGLFRMAERCLKSRSIAGS